MITNGSYFTHVVGTVSALLSMPVMITLCQLQCIHRISDHFENYYRIFTDGSKEGNRVAAAVVHWDNTKCVRLPDMASIFRAELYALLLAIDVVRHSKEKNFVIFSDSLSSLQVIVGFNIDSDLVQKSLKDYTILAKNGKNIVLCWISSHVGIPRNEKADAVAKSALSLSITLMKLPATDMLPRVMKPISLQRFTSIFFTNCAISTRITVAYTPMVLKWVNE